MGKLRDTIEFRKNFPRSGKSVKKGSERWKLWILWILVSVLVCIPIRYEIQTSHFQSRFLSEYAEKLSYDVGPGPSENIVFPKNGPFNKRRGYDRIPDFRRRLENLNYEVTEQARFSPELVEIAKRGVSPPYQEEPVTGLTIYNSEGMTVYDATARRMRIFTRFGDIPVLMVKALLFIEDRELANTLVPSRNPVINWNRLAMAGILYGASKVGLPVRVEGGSTLATQLEKYRYSPGGNTSSVIEKLRQMTAASLRVYKEGSDTRLARQKIILDYVNTAPLAAVPGYGEIYGLGEGFYAWFGRDMDTVSTDLLSPEPDQEKVVAFRQSLTLLCAVRGPTHYLTVNYPALEQRVSDYIHLMEHEGLIGPEFATLLLETPVDLSPVRFPSNPLPFSVRKAVNSVRTKLMQTLGVSGYYDLDRLDVKVETTISTGFQEEVGDLFEKLGDDEFLAENGLKSRRLLSTGDGKKVIYSFLLFETTPYGNLLRVQADNLREAFDINEGMKLILGSTAKLRTLANYLELIALLYRELSGLDKEEIRNAFVMANDPITRWVAEKLGHSTDISLETLLDAALERRYSASPYESFFTGGGIHKFVNFRSKHNSQILSVREATLHSINLVYIRLMEDIVRFYRSRLPYDADEVLKDSEHPRRRQLLEEIADNEAKVYMRRFYKSFRGLGQDEVLDLLLGKRKNSPRSLTITFLAWHQDVNAEKLSRWLEKRANVSPGKVGALLNAYDKPHFTISDYGYLLRKHPLEVWCAGEMIRSPDISWRELVEKSGEPRRLCSAWLLQPKMRRHQNLRLRTRIEKDAFEGITECWRRLGFPFKRLVPSYSTAIGSSCDKPAALARLIGIILNNGIHRPAVVVSRIRMAEGTPYHTIFDMPPPPGEQVMEPDVAEILRGVLQAVVEKGTARRVRGAFVTPDGIPVPAGGKTGTGDNRLKRINSNGNMISSKALNRTATFAFYIGKRYFGVITAFVTGKGTDEYSFTSALPVSILKLLAPAISSRFASHNIQTEITSGANVGKGLRVEG